MEDKNTQNPQIEWIDPEGKLTPDQWMKCHLLLFTHILSHKYGPFKFTERKDLSDYTQKAYTLLRKAATATSEIQLNKELQAANDSLCDLYINVNREDSDSSEYVRFYHLRLLRIIVNYVKENLSDLPFNEYFSDIFFDEEGLYSPMAIDILSKYIAKLEDEELFEHWEEPEQIEVGEMAFSLLMENWNEDHRILMGLSVERGMLFHALALLLCHKCLNCLLYESYQKCVVDAMTTFQSKTSQKQKKASVQNANEAFVKLMAEVHALIKKGIYDHHEFNILNEYFALSSGFAILMAKTSTCQLVRQMLNDISVKDDDLIAKDTIISCIENFFQQSIVECARIHSELSIDDEDEELVSFEEELVEILSRSWEDVKGILTELPIECALIVHTISLVLCTKLLYVEQYDNYLKAVEKALSAYNGNSNQKQKMFALNRANQALDKLKNELFELTLAEEDEDDIDDESSHKRDIFNMSVINCIRLVQISIDKKKASFFLKYVSFVKDSFRTPIELEGYVNCILNSSLGDLDNLYNQLGDGDEDDYEGEDEDWEDDDDYESDDLDDIVGVSIDVLLDLKRNQNLFFHAISVNIMRNLLPHALFDNYSKAVERLLSSFIQVNYGKGKVRGRQNADDEYINTISLLYKIYQNYTQEETKSEVAPFMLAFNATKRCLNAISNEDNSNCIKSLEALTFNKKNGVYTNPSIESFAKRFVDLEKGSEEQ